MKQKGKWKERALFLFGVLAIGVALYKIVPTWLDYQESEQTYEDLEEEYLTINDILGDGTEEKKDWWSQDVDIAFEELRKENEDIIAWIRFDHPESLDISYPVLYSGDNKKYFRSDIYGEKHIAGCIFLEGLNELDFSDYYSILYGHNMNDGSMFGSLDKLREEGFYEENAYFTLYTEGKAYRYQIFSFHDAPNDGEVYKIGYEPGTEYQEFINGLVESSEIETGIFPKAANKILTLSTCTGEGYGERFAVHAVCVDEQETEEDKLK